MAQWSDYINQFPESEQIIIQELQNALENEFGFTNFNSFESGFNPLSSVEFVSSEASNTFFSELSTLLQNKASISSDWAEFRDQFHLNNSPYIDLIVQSYDGTLAALLGQEEGSRSEHLKNIEGFWEAYITMLNSYLEDLHNTLSIAQQPTSSEVDWNTNHTLFVEATGIGTLSFQWRKNNTPISGATSTELLLENVKTDTNGQYDCIVSDSLGQIISTKATISVASFSSEIFKVHGIIENSNEVPLSNITVKVFDKKPGNTKELGSTTTDSKGAYTIEYLKAALFDQESFTANLIVKLFEEGATEASDTSGLIEEASKDEEINLTTTAFVETQTEFALVSTYITETLDEDVILTDLDSEDIQLLVNKSFSEEMIKMFIQASSLNSAVNTVSVEHFYGLLAVGLPPILEEIGAYSTEKIATLLLNASDQKIITELDSSVTETITSELKEAITLNIEQSTESSFSKVFQKISLTTEKRTKIIEAYLNSSPEDSYILDSISEENIDGGLSNSEISEIKRIVSIQALDESNSELIDILDTQENTPTISELAVFTIDQWKALIDNDNENLLSIPARFNGTDIEKKDAYAKELKQSAEIKEPTIAVIAQISADPEITSLNIDEFFTNNPEFKFEHQKVGEFLQDNPLVENNYTNPIEDVIKSVEGVQRLFHITPEVDKFEVIKPLLREELDSSVKIALLGHSGFIDLFSNKFGNDIVEEVWDKAMQTYGKVINIAVKYQNVPGPLVIGKDPIDNSKEVPGIANLETLFGSLDYCECKHCRSVYSPAAYLADLLNFIEGHAEHFDPTDPNPDKLPLNSYYLKQKLIDNRPEIQNLHLNCKNTNTVLPYIDIVNEILENAINGSINTNQTEHDAATLRARPQNTIDSVYTTLSTAVSPSNLPFNLSFEEAKSYCNEAGVSLSELIKVLPKGDVSELEHKANFSAAFFGISPQQLAIINGTRTDIDPAELTYTDLYNVSDMAELINPLGTFLKKTGISLEEFEELILSKFVNPNQKILHFPADGSCNLDAITFGHDPEKFADPETDPDYNPAEGFSEEELVKFNRFLRLYRITGWSAKDLDIIINALGSDSPGPDKLNNLTIVTLYNIAQLKEQFNLEVEELILWWKDFDVFTYADENMMDKLFQNIAVNTKSTDINIPLLADFDTAAPLGSLNDTNIKSLVQGAVKLSAKQVDYILSTGEISNAITIENLSYLYRISSFMKANRLSIEEYFKWKNLVGFSALKSQAEITTDDTLHFIEKMELVRTSPFSMEDIFFLMRTEINKDFSLTNEEIEGFIDDLRETYNGIQIPAFPLEINTDSIDEELDFLFNKYLIDESHKTYIEGIISGDSFNPYGEESLATPVLGKFVSDSEMDSLFDELQSSPAEETRKQIFYNFFQRYYIIESNINLAETIGAFFDMPSDVANELLLLKNVTTSVTLKDMLLDKILLESTNTPSKANYPHYHRIIRNATKVALLYHRIGFSASAMNHLTNNSTASLFELNRIPVDGETSIAFADLEGYISLASLDKTAFQGEVKLIDYLANQTVANRLSELADATEWPLEDITILAAADGFDFTSSSDYKDIPWIFQLNKVLTALNKAGIDATTVGNLSLSNPDADTSFGLRNTLKSKFGSTQWLEIAEKVHDPIRETKRDAMVAYMINDTVDFNFDSETDLYNHFLIDTQMSACQLTSRIKQAISATQLFIQRIQLGFEDNLFISKQKMQEWDWIKNYRVWEANRKVFLYPENYLLPELRTNQSQLFKNFTEALNQEEVTTELASEAYQRYIEELPTVTNLEINQMTYDDYSDTLHIVANDQQDPKQFFHRTCKDQSLWTPWELIPIDLQGGVLPIIHRGKLMLFWLEVKGVKSQPTSIKTDDPTDLSEEQQKAQAKNASDSQFEVRLAWTTKEKNTWAAKKLTASTMIVPSRTIADELVISPMLNQHSELFITILGYQTDIITNTQLELTQAFKLVLGNLEPITGFNEVPNNNADTLFVKDTEYIEKDEFGNTTNSYLSGFDSSHFSLNTQNGSFDNWKVKRAFNLATESGIFNTGENRISKYKNQKLALSSQARLSVPFKVIYTFPGDNQTTEYSIVGTKLLSPFSDKSFTLIRDMEEEFPMLVNQKWTKPFIIKEGARYYIAFVQQINNTKEEIDITEHNRILRSTPLHGKFNAIDPV